MARRTRRLLLSSLLLLTACGGDEGVVLPPAPEPAAVQTEAAETLDVPVRFENLLGMRFVLVPAGTFAMGAPRDEVESYPDETQHEVTLSRAFYLQTTEVTNAWFRAWRSDHHSSISGHLDGPAQPVVRVTWTEAEAFARWLTEQDGERTYRLPTEAEWEYACRAGTVTPYAFGAASRPDLANFDGTTTYGGGPAGPRRLRTVDVGSMPPNAWGLYEMHGNAWEWCRDAYGPYPDGPVTDPTGPETSAERVYRGGAYEDAALDVRSASRGRLAPDQKTPLGGFRLVSPLPEGR